MPVLSAGGYRSPSRLGLGGTGPNGMQIQQAVDYSVTQDRNALSVVGGVGALGALDLVDTVASSVPGISKALGIQRGDINRAALQAIDLPGLGDFYHDYKGGIEATSGIMGAIGAELVTRKLTAPTSLFMGMVRQLPYARRLAVLDQQYDNALMAVRAADTNLAARGALGAEQYVGRTVIERSMWDSATGQFINATEDVARNSVVRSAKFWGAAKLGTHAALTEGVMALTLNQNSFLYDDSAAHNMAWMGLGVGIGAAGGWLHGAYQIRKFVNSDEIRRTFADALDPGSAETERLLWHGKKVKGDETVSFLGGLFSDRITNLLVNARTLTETSHAGTTDAAALEASRNRLATQWTALAREETQKLTRKGISSNGYTRFSMEAPGYGNHVDMMLRRDPASFYGVEMVGGVADDTSAANIHRQHTTRLQELIDGVEERIGGMLDDDGNLLEDANPSEMADLQRYARRLDFESTLTPMVTIDGELMPMSEAEAFAGFKEPELSFRADDDLKVKGFAKGTTKQILKGDRHGLWEIRSENPKGNISLDTSFVYHIPGNKKLDGADIYDVMRLYRLGNKAVDQMARFKGPLALPKKPDWFQLDMAEELLRRTDGRANVVFPEGMTRESARIESLLQKSEAVKKWDKLEAAKALKEESKGNTYEGQLSKLRLRYNLPKLTAYERGLLGNEAEHPVESLLRGIGQLKRADVEAMNLGEIRETMARFKRLGDVAPVQKSDLEDMGNSFSFMLDEKGNPLKPVMVYKRPFKVAEWTQEHNAERLAAAKMNAVNAMIGADASPMTRAISQGMLASPDFDAVARTNELMDTQVQGGLAGAAPQSMVGAFGKALVSSDWRDRDNPILLAATRLREAVSRQARDFMKTTIEKAFGGELAKLANPRNATSKLLLNQFHSFRPGWDIATEPVKRNDGFFGFILRPTKDNQERFRQLFNRDMNPKGQLLLAPNGKEVVLDELGLNLQQRFNMVTEAIRGEKNTILRANGRGEISQLDWYTPPPNTNNKFIGFTLGPDNKPIPGMTVVADTQAEFARGRDEMLRRIEEMGLGYTFRTQESIREFANIWDKVQMDFVNPGTTAVQPGKQSRGVLAGQSVRTDAFQESLTYLQDSFLDHATDITNTLLREQINAAKARGLVSGEMTRNLARKGYSGESRNIYDYYLENLLGKNKLGKSWVGNIYRSIEGPLDKFLSETTPVAAKVWHATNEWLNKSNPWSKTEQARKDFDALSTALGKYMPFESAAEMAERQGLGATPPTVAKLTGSLNKFSATLILRMMEVVHPIMNLSGIVNASPAVIRQFTPQRGESLADFSKRIGHAATIFELGDGRALGVLDMPKVMQSAFKKAWSREAHPDYDYMVRRGFLSQEVAEFQRQFGAIDSPGKWRTFFEGDPNKKGFRNKGVVGWASILSDKSEDFSRSWGHMVGLEIADNLGIKSIEARHAFAHDIANKMIANYSPHNRPEIFQGAIGAPFGLFQSFVMNYYERMFRYIETADYKSLATQLATQSGLFGVTSIPGWQQFNAFMTKESGEDDPSSAIWRRFGGNAGDLIGHGVLASLPGLFGAPGADLYSRGDVSIRQLSIQDPTSIPGILGSTVPAFNVVQKLWTGIGEGIKLFSDKNPNLSTTQLGEVLSNMIANRPIAGMIEQFMAHGNDTDARGQLVSQTQNGMEMAYRLIGIRSSRMSRELEAFYANKNAQTHQAALKEDLSQYTRAMIRDGNMEALPEVFEQYIKNGGDPRNFRRWLKGTYVAATSTRGQRMLEKVAKDPSKMEQILRLLDAGVTVNDDEALGNDADKLYVAGDADSPELAVEGADW
jgi:hypothetical protein